MFVRNVFELLRLNLELCPVHGHRSQTISFHLQWMRLAVSASALDTSTSQSSVSTTGAGDAAAVADDAASGVCACAWG